MGLLTSASRGRGSNLHSQPCDPSIHFQSRERIEESTEPSPRSPVSIAPKLRLEIPVNGAGGQRDRQDLVILQRSVVRNARLLAGD